MTLPTILIFHEGLPSGADGLLRWRRYERRPNEETFSPNGEPGQLSALAHAALGDALKRNTNVYVGWGDGDPTMTPADEVEAAVSRLWPVTIFAPVDGERWAMSSFGEGAILSRRAVEQSILDFCHAHFPQWQPGIHFRACAAIIRVDSTAEALGLIQPHEVTFDEICALV
jgi:hypothetical protein